MKTGRITAAAVALALAVGAAACGEDSQSAEEYRSDLDGACIRLSDELNEIPQRVSDEDLDPERAQGLAEDASRHFTETVDGLDPPDELSDAHEDLIAQTGEDPPTESVDEAIAYTERYGEIYDSLGAEECSRLQAEALEGFRTLG